MPKTSGLFSKEELSSGQILASQENDSTKNRGTSDQN